MVSFRCLGKGAECKYEPLKSQSVTCAATYDYNSYWKDFKTQTKFSDSLLATGGKIKGCGDEKKAAYPSTLWTCQEPTFDTEKLSRTVRCMRFYGASDE